MHVDNVVNLHQVERKISSSLKILILHKLFIAIMRWDEVENFAAVDSESTISLQVNV